MVAVAPAEKLDGGQSATDLVATASRRLADGDGEAALSALATAAAIDPNCLPLHFMTALIAWRSGNFAQALHLARACFERDPMNGTVAEVLASLFAQVGNLQESLFHGKLATALAPDNALNALLPPEFPSFDKAFLAIHERPLFAHAKYCRANGDIPLALDRVSQHVEVAPEDGEARQFYGELLLRFGMASTAVETLRPAVEGRDAAPMLASLHARALTAVGDFAEGRRWHEKARSIAPQEGSIAAAYLADAVWLGDGETVIAAAGARWVERFAKPSRPASRHAPGEKLVIGYIVSDLVDRSDAAAVAAVARAHDRKGARVIAYGVGAKSWDENILLAAAFDQWRDISRLDAATFARMLAADGLDLVIDLGGWVTPATLQALARSRSPLRVAWLHEPAGLESIYDAVIVGEKANDGPTSPRRWPASGGAYPILPSRRARPAGAGDGHFRLGADIRLRQLDDATTELWSALLSAMPQSVLLLRQNDMTSRGNIDRLVERFGRDLARRVDIVEAAAPGEFYRQVDLAVAPRTGTSPRMVAEALGAGVPALALRHAGMGQAYAVMLQDLGLGQELVAFSREDYVNKAKALASSAETRSRVADAISVVMASAEDSAARIAKAIEAAARETLVERAE